jgi:hypothetical protein
VGSPLKGTTRSTEITPSPLLRTAIPGPDRDVPEESDTKIRHPSALGSAVNGAPGSRTCVIGSCVARLQSVACTTIGANTRSKKAKTVGALENTDTSWVALELSGFGEPSVAGERENATCAHT